MHKKCCCLDITKLFIAKVIVCLATFIIGAVLLAVVPPARVYAGIAVAVALIYLTRAWRFLPSERTYQRRTIARKADEMVEKIRGDPAALAAVLAGPGAGGGRGGNNNHRRNNRRSNNNNNTSNNNGGAHAPDIDPALPNGAQYYPPPMPPMPVPAAPPLALPPPPGTAGFASPPPHPPYGYPPCPPAPMYPPPPPATFSAFTAGGGGGGGGFHEPFECGNSYSRADRYFSQPQQPYFDYPQQQQWQQQQAAYSQPAGRFMYG